MGFITYQVHIFGKWVSPCDCPKFTFVHSVPSCVLYVIITNVFSVYFMFSLSKSNQERRDRDDSYLGKWLSLLKVCVRSSYNQAADMSTHSIFLVILDIIISDRTFSIIPKHVLYLSSLLYFVLYILYIWKKHGESRIFLRTSKKAGNQVYISQVTGWHYSN